MITLAFDMIKTILRQVNTTFHIIRPCLDKSTRHLDMVTLLFNVTTQCIEKSASHMDIITLVLYIIRQNLDNLLIVRLLFEIISSK